MHSQCTVSELGYIKYVTKIATIGYLLLW